MNGSLEYRTQEVWIGNRFPEPSLRSHPGQRFQAMQDAILCPVASPVGRINLTECLSQLLDGSRTNPFKPRLLAELNRAWCAPAIPFPGTEGSPPPW